MLSFTATEPAGGKLASAHERSLRHLLIYGGATLGLAVGVERILGFVAAMLAARIGGPRNFGAYSVVLATAGTIATYAGAGIGATANRFSGQYSRDSTGYRGFLRTLVIISVLSATLAAMLMLAGAGPLARWMLKNEALTTFLRLAALSSGALVLLECCRGLLIGQQRFFSLLILSLISGIGLVVALPFTAQISPGAMVAGQGTIAMLAVLCCVAFSRRLGIAPTDQVASTGGPRLRPVFMFGVVQFSAVAGVSIASWWIASLVARSDSSLGQMGMYAVANQFRGLAAMAPGLIIQVGYPLLTNEAGPTYGGPRRVLLANTLLTTILVALVAGLAMTFLPWALSFAYGRNYLAGEAAVLLLLATAIIHLGGQPAAQRLSIVSLRATGVINTAWAVLIVLLGLFLVPKAGAPGAAAAFLIAHGLGNAMVLAYLTRSDDLPGGYLPMSASAAAAALALTGIGYARMTSPAHEGALTLAMLAVLTLFLSILIYIGITTKCITPSLFRPYLLTKAYPAEN